MSYNEVKVDRACKRRTCNKCNKPIEKNDLCIRFEGFHSSANMCMPCVEKGVNEQNSIREEIK